MGLLSKICHHTSQNLRSIYFSLFNSHLIYGCQILGQEHNIEFKKKKKKKGKLQAKAIRIIKFLPNNASITKTVKELKILTLQNILFVKDSLINEEMTSFDKIFQ